MFLACALAGLLLVLGFGSWYFYQKAKKADLRVVCFGDSLTACGGYGGRYSDFLAEALPESEVVNKGIGGDTLEGGRRRFKNDVLALHPKVVVIELGANDFHQHNRTIVQLRNDLEFMVQALRNRGIGVVIAGVFGDQLDKSGKIIPKEYKEGSSDFGEKILQMEASIAKEYDCLHVPNIQADLNQDDHWADHRHPGPKGNKLVAARLLPAIQKLLKKHLAQKEP